MGPNHKKTPLSEITRTYGTILGRKIADADRFYNDYRETETGEYFDSYIDFYETCKLGAYNLRQHYDKEDPWKKQTPFLFKFVEQKKKIEDLVKRYNNEGGKKMGIVDFLKIYREYNDADKGLQEAIAALTQGAKGGAHSINYDRQEVTVLTK